MNILFITTKTPWPENDGHSLRSCNLLRQAAQKHTVHLISCVKYPEEKESVVELKKFCRSVQLIDVPANVSRWGVLLTGLLAVLRRRPVVVEKYNLLALSSRLRQTLAEADIDLIHLDMLPLAIYLRQCTGYPVVLDEHNVESALLAQKARHASGWQRLFFTWQSKWLRSFEEQAVAHVDQVIACSEADASQLRQWSGSTPVSVIPNGVDTDYFHWRSETAETPSLLFIGGFNWFPNQQGMQWFDQEILPLLISRMPQLQIHVIGQSAGISWRHPEHIQTLGAVADIRPYLTSAVIFIVPLQIGGGTRLKILNAMASGLAVVSTSLGAEGLAVHDGQDILLADSAEQFAAAVQQLAGSAEMRHRIGQAARQTIVDHYTWESIGRDLRKAYCAARDRYTERTDRP